MAGRKGRRKRHSLLVLVLEGQGKAIDDRAEDFEQLSHAIVPLSVINEAIKHVADCLADEGAMRHELACKKVRVEHVCEQAHHGMP